jgi:hypothetical protein
LTLLADARCCALSARVCRRDNLVCARPKDEFTHLTKDFADVGFIVAELVTSTPHPVLARAAAQ